MTIPFETTERIVSLYESGLNQIQIAKLYGVTSAAVSYRLKTAGVEIRKNTFSPQAKEAAKRNHTRGEKHHNFHDLPVKEIESLYLSGETTECISYKYNVSAITIQRLLRKNDIPRRSSGFGTQYTAKDGHKLASYFELVVDNWLFERGVAHVTHPSLPFGRNSRADFLFANTYIEVMGMFAWLPYREKYTRKLSLYKQHGLKVVCIFPSHLRNNCSALERLLFHQSS